MSQRFIGLVFGLACVMPSLRLHAQEDPEVAGYDYILGTQTIGPAYHFTSDDPITESAQAIAAMGSTMLKSKGVESRDDLLALPIRTYFSWFDDGDFYDGVSAAQKTVIRDSAYATAKSLLQRFNGSGRTFFLGHWEGDWLLLGGTANPKEPSAKTIQGMIDWYNARQQGIDDAKRDVPHANVEVYQYAEVNRVRDALVDGNQRIVNAVLPHTQVDYVSYSSYDVMRLGQAAVDSTLDYVASKLPPKAGIMGKRVFVGEFGIPADEMAFDGIKHEKANRDILIKFMKWGCPYILYWEMYNNEIKNGAQRGFWLINDKNEKQPLYHTLQHFLAEGKAYVVDRKAKTGAVPAAPDFQTWAIAWLENYQPSTGLLNRGDDRQDGGATRSHIGRSRSEAPGHDPVLCYFEFSHSGTAPALRFRADGERMTHP